MVTENDILDTIKQLNGSGKTFAEFIATLYKDKFIEVYIGDTYEDVSTEQVSTAYPAVYVGKVIGAYKECLVMNCAYVDHRHLKIGNFMFVNERAIRALNLVDGNGTLDKMMMRSHESLDVLHAFGNK